MIHGKLLLFMLAAAYLIQLTVPLTRLAVTYQALHLGLSGAYAGALAAAFALVPVFLAVWFGHFNDRGNLGISILGGAAIMAASVAFLWLAPAGLPTLFVGIGILGIGQTLHYSGLQMVVIRASTRPHRDGILGNYLLALSLGDATAPLFVSFAGTRDPALIGGHLLFCAAITVTLLLGMALVLFRLIPKPNAADDTKPMALVRILRAPGLFWVLLSGSVCATTQDLISIYIPVLGLERQIDLALVGFLLSAASIATVASRATFGLFSAWLGRRQLMLVSALAAAAALALMLAPLPVWMLFVTFPLIGFALGTGATVTLSLALNAAPRGTRATTLALRQMGNRLGLFLLPFVFGTIGALFGIGAIFATMALSVTASNGLAYRSSKAIEPAQR